MFLLFGYLRYPNNISGSHGRIAILFINYIIFIWNCKLKRLELQNNVHSFNLTIQARDNLGCSCYFYGTPYRKNNKNTPNYPWPEVYNYFFAIRLVKEHHK
jgi:hypothetical protein